jgi:hypothetical protein
MPSDRWLEVAALFDELVELAPADRSRRLAEIERADVVLGAEVRALLDADAGGNVLLDADAAAAIPRLNRRARPCRKVTSTSPRWPGTSARRWLRKSTTPRRLLFMPSGCRNGTPGFPRPTAAAPTRTNGSPKHSSGSVGSDIPLELIWG